MSTLTLNNVNVNDEASKAIFTSPVYANGIKGVAVDGTSFGCAADPSSIVSILYAKQLLAGIPNPADYDLDGLISLAIVGSNTVQNNNSNRRQKRDQWKYAENDDQSYMTLDTQALRSDTTVEAESLEASNTHFMMFKSGNSKIDCFRFRFTNTTAYAVDPDGNPAGVDDDFFNLCGLSDWSDLTCDVLKVHAQRLEVIQHALASGVIAGREAKHTQFLFEHFLGELVKALPGGDTFRVGSVAGMEPVKVAVEISNTYLASQNRPTVNGATGKQVVLTAESDVVVVDVSSNHDHTNKKENFLNCSYSIEMKDAGNFKNSATKPKSQLIAESLAKHLERKAKSNPPEVIYSVLCDGYSLCIMLHFVQDQIAFLSHREIEPGRMVVLLAWLHRLATSNTNPTSSSFRNMKLVEVGDKMEEEITGSLQKKRPTSTGGGGGGAKQRSRKQQAKAGSKSMDEPSKKKLAATEPPEDAWFCLDLPASDRREREEETAQQLSMFSALRNYRSFRDPLPATESIVQLMETKNEGVMSPYKERMARLDASKA